MAYKVDPANGLNADQSGPREKIQNGDPTAGANRDQRASTVESGGPNESIQTGDTNDGNAIPPHTGLVTTDKNGNYTANPPAATGQLPVGAHDFGGSSPTLGSNLG